MLRVNVGCGPTPTPGWLNFDNSPSIALARFPGFFSHFLAWVGAIKREQALLIHVAKRHEIRRANALRLPLEEGTVDVLYSSHMLEHLDHREARRFLSECARVMRPGGWLRLLVPDLKRYVDAYEATGDADVFIEQLRLAQPRTRGLRRAVELLTGFRGHRWMYDATSLTRLIERAGFVDVEILVAGETRIPEPGELDLREREGDSLYLEARRP